MTLDEFLALVRTGEVYIAITQPIDKDHVDPKIKLTIHDASKAKACVDVLREHQADIYWMLMRSEVTTCMDPNAHRGNSYRYMKDAFSPESFFTCEACSAIRAA